LRVHDLRTGYGGGGTNRIEGECIFKLSTESEKAFGFEMRDDRNYPARQAMFSLLRDALVNRFEVRIEYFVEVGSMKQNHTAFRIELLRPAPPAPVGPSNVNALTNH
jgi:hypothetical protein